MSLHARTCPQCQGALDIEGACRVCARAIDRPSEQLVMQAEALYASYLAARIVRARRALKIAKVELLRDPRSREKADAVRCAEEETQRLQAQLVTHTRDRTETRDVPAGDTVTANIPTEQAPPNHADAPPAEPPAPRLVVEQAGAHARQDDRRCPRCGAQAPGGVSQCRCGYTFESTGTGPPPVFLTAAELAALRNSGRRR